MAHDCPKCGLTNPDSAERCDCGFDFETRRVERSYANPGDPDNIAEIGLTLSQVGKRNMFIGSLAFLIGIVVTGLTELSSAKTGFWIVAWGAIVFGVVQFIRGLRQFWRGRSENCP